MPFLAMSCRICSSHFRSPSVGIQTIFEPFFANIPQNLSLEASSFSRITLFFGVMVSQKVVPRTTYFMQSGLQSFQNIRIFGRASPPIWGSIMRWRYNIPVNLMPLRKEDASHSKMCFAMTLLLLLLLSKLRVSTSVKLISAWVKL